MRKLLVVVFALSILGGLRAQELNFKVIVNAEQVQTTDRGVFKDMERAFANFLNTRKWTNDSYKNYEKITFYTKF